MKNCIANSKLEETGFNYTMPLIRAIRDDVSGKIKAEWDMTNTMDSK